MKTLKLAAAGALVLAISAAQPSAAFAGSVLPPPASASASNPAAAVLPMAWAVGIFICTGLTWGKMQVDAQKAHRELTGADAFRGIGRCLFPPFGFARLMQGK